MCQSIADSLLMTEASSDCDMVIGRLLKLATVMSPHLAKIWHEFANWALEMGEWLYFYQNGVGFYCLTQLNVFGPPDNWHFLP